MSNPILDQERAAFLRSRQRIGAVLLPAWPRQSKELPLVQVEVDWVRFSTLNHRTKAEQMRVIAQIGKEDLFTADPIGPAAQSAQYRVLSEQEGFTALKMDLKERGQQDPAIITADGILINGNRRCAALRSLFRDDNFLDAGYVKCLILPEDATSAELVDLEAELQVARDFKQDYSWINEALLIEELYDREDKDFERVAKRMHRAVADVRALHEKLQQVHQLVALSNGARLHIDFNENESAFDELARHIKGKPAEEANAVRAVYFLGTIANVNYRKLRHLRRDDAAVLVMNEVENDPSLKPLLESLARSMSAPVSEDALDEVLGAETNATGLDAILGFLATKRPEETISFPSGETVDAKDVLDSLRSVVTAAADEAEEGERDKTAVGAPINRSSKAIEELKRAVMALPKARAFAEWNEDELAQNVRQLEGLVSLLKLE